MKTKQRCLRTFTLLPLALCLAIGSSKSTTTLPQELPGKGGSGSLRRRTNQQAHHKNKNNHHGHNGRAKNNQDVDKLRTTNAKHHGADVMQPKMEGISNGRESSANLCRSIIAIDGWRKKPSNDKAAANVRRTEDTLQYEDEETDPNEEWIRIGAEESGGMMALPILDDEPEVLIQTPDADETSYVVVDNGFETLYEDGILRVPYEDPPSSIPQTEEEFVCELQDGSTLPISGTEEQISELRQMLNNGTLISAMDSVEVEEPSAVDGETGIAGVGLETSITLPPGSIRLVSNSDHDINDGDLNIDGDDGTINLDSGFSSRRRRRLNMYEGVKKTLVVRVIDKQGRQPDEDAEYISDKFFGTNGDPMTMTSGFDACSFGKFQVSYDYGGQFADKLAADGVLEVELNINLSTATQPQVRYAAVTAVQNKLGISLPGPFAHVAFVVEKCYPNDTSCSFAAYAYVNHWMSLFVEDNYKFPAVQMHEIGHNLNLAHSGGLNGATYTDHTCLMGNPLWEDNVGKMCFNPVKNFQISRGNGDNGWYDTQSIANFITSPNPGTSWSGRLIGVAEYNTNPSNLPIVLKIESGGSKDWFVGFNRDYGANSDVKQAGDLVTVYKVSDGDGKEYSHSFLKGVLQEGTTMKIVNWRGTTEDLEIEVKEINTSVSPGYADIEVRFGETSSPTEEPTKKPTEEPTKSPTKAPTTPNPTTSPVGPVPTTSPTAPMPTSSPSKAPTATPTTKPTNTPTTTDPCGDGTCDASSGEDPENCPADCLPIIFEIQNSKQNNGNAAGQMFMLEAETTSTVTSLGIVGKKDGEGEVKVYTRSGDFSGHEENSEGWDLIYDKKVTVEKGKSKMLPGGLLRDITIDAGSNVSFYVFAKKGLLFTKGNNQQKNMPFDGDGKIMIKEGVATQKLFEKVNGNGRYSGEISYYTSASTQGGSPSPPVTSSPTKSPTIASPTPPTPPTDGNVCGDGICGTNENPDSCHNDCPVKVLDTAAGNNANDDSAGQMFTITPSMDLTVFSFDILGKRDGDSDIEVYTRPGTYMGKEEDDAGWELLLDTKVSLDKDSMTSLGKMDREVLASAGQIQSFYIYSKKGLQHTKGGSHGVFADDGLLAIYEGIATEKWFEQVTQNTRYHGLIRYYVSSTSTRN